MKFSPIFSNFEISPETALTRMWRNVQNKKSKSKVLFLTEKSNWLKDSMPNNIKSNNNVSGQAPIKGDPKEFSKGINFLCKCIKKKPNKNSWYDLSKKKMI